MKKAVGFDQKILLDHLNYTMNKASYTKKEEMYKKLDQYLIKDIKCPHPPEPSKIINRILTIHPTILVRLT